MLTSALGSGVRRSLQPRLPAHRLSLTLSPLQVQHTGLHLAQGDALRVHHHRLPGDVRGSAALVLLLLFMMTVFFAKKLYLLKTENTKLRRTK